MGCTQEVSCWVDECPLALSEVCRWQCQIRVGSMCALLVPLGLTKPLQVALRWQALAQEGWYATSA